MTVYSYISESILLTIADVANEEIGTYADLIVSTFSATRSKFVNAKGQLEESIVYDYNESSEFGLVSDDYGLITDTIVDQADYGSVAESDYYPWQQEDYGFLGNNETLKPFGRLFVVRSIPVENVARSESGQGVRFALAGNANIGVLPLVYGSGYIVAHGSAIERRVGSHLTSGSLFAIGGVSESATYSYNESSVVNPFGDDYGLITDSIVDQDDYGFIIDGTYYPWQQDDYGFLQPDYSRFPYGRINIEGKVLESFSRTNYIGSGNIKLSGTVNVFVVPKQIGSGLFDFNGTADQKTVSDYIGSGSIFTFISSSEVSGSNPPESTELFKISGSVVERNTESYVGSGSLFGLGGASEVSSSNPPESTELFKITGSVAERNTESYVGSGSLFKIVDKIERRTYSYNESAYVGTVVGDDYGLITDSIVDQDDYGFIIDGTYYPWQQDDYGFLRPDGSLIPYGRINIEGNAIDRRLYVYAHDGSGSLFTAGQARTYVTPRQLGEGIVRFGGSSFTGFSLRNIGFGSLFTFISSSEVSVSNPPESTELFRISGFGLERNTESYVGSGSLFGLGGASEVSGSNPPESTELFKITGSAIEKNVESYIGSGSIVLSNVIDKNINSDIRFFTQTEVVSWNPPTIPSIFDVRGSAIEKNVESYVGSGSANLDSAATTIFRLKHIGSCQIEVSGLATENFTKSPYIGSGSIFTFISSSEVSSSNPPESTELFKITGSVAERNTESYVGSGSANLDSAATTIFRLKHIGSGIIDVNDSAKESTTPAPYIGSGSIFTFISSSEVSVSNPPESTELFRISGFGLERNTESYVGSGTIFTFISSSEVSVSNPPESTELFKIAGNSEESTTPTPYIGSGSIFTFISSSEVSGSNPPESTELFRISGSAVVNKTQFYIGSGSIFTFISSSEVSGSNPPESTELFKISGSAATIKVGSYQSSGNIKISGSAATIKVGSYQSSGNIKISDSAVTVFRLRVESQINARISGQSLNSLSRFAVIDAQIIHLSGSALDIAISKVENGVGNVFVYSGSPANEKNTDAYLGKGSIRTLSGAAQTISITYTLSRVLFRISGAIFESYSRANYDGSEFIQLSNQSETKYLEYDSPKPTRLYII